MTIAGRVGLSLLAAVVLAALGIVLGSIVARVNQSAADTLDLRSSVLQASGDQLGLWHDEAKTDPVLESDIPEPGAASRYCRSENIHLCRSWHLFLLCMLSGTPPRTSSCATAFQ